MNEKTNKELRNNIIIFGLGTLGTKLIQVLLIPLYSSYLSTAEYSTSDILVSTVSLLIPMFSLGFNNSIVRFGLNQKENEKTILKLSLYICFFGTIILAVTMPLYRNVRVFSGYAYVLPILYFLELLKTFLASFCKAQEKNITYAADGIITTLVLTTSSFYFIAILDLKVMGYIMGIGISQIVSIVYLSINCRIHRVLLGAHIDRSLLKDMIRYSIPLVPNELAWWVIQMSDRYMVIYMRSASENGLYSMAYKIPGVFNLLVGIFSQAFGITAFKRIDSVSIEDGKDEYFDRVYKIYTELTFVSVTVIIVFSQLISMLINKKEFVNCWVYTPVLLCAFAVGNLQAFWGIIYGGLKKTNVVFISTVAGMIVNIVLNLIMIPKMGAHGASIATLISYIVVFAVRAYKIRDYIKVRLNITQTILSLVMIILLSVVYVIRPANYILYCIVLSVLIFIENKEFFLMSYQRIVRSLKRNV